MTPFAEPSDVAGAYFAAWKARDFRRLRSLLADDVTFVGPLGPVDGADAYVESMERVSQRLDDVEVKKIFTDGPDAVTWFELRPTGAPPFPVANWSHVVDGKITEVRVTFDPRPLLSGEPPTPR